MRKQLMFGMLAVVLLFGVVGLASADVVPYPGAEVDPGPPSRHAASNSGDPVDVKANVRPKITLTVDTPDTAQSVDFLDADPGVAESADCTLTVLSNKLFTLAKTPGGHVAELGLTTSLAGASGLAKGGWTATDTYAINVPYTTDPGVYLATMQYTVTQD